MAEVYDLFQPSLNWDKNQNFLADHPGYTWQLNTAYKHFRGPQKMTALANNYNAVLNWEDNLAWLRFKNEEDGIKARDDMKRFYEVIVPALARAYMTDNEVKTAIEEITEPFTMMDEMSK